MQEYYGDCYAHIIQNGMENYPFYNVIEGEELLNAWYQNYRNDYYRQAYMDNAMTEIGASSCEMSLEMEQLQGELYLIIHNVSIW